MMFKLIFVFFLYISVGCQSYLEEKVIALGADIATPYLEDEIPKNVEVTLKDVFSRDKFKKAVAFLRLFNKPVGHLKPFFEKEEKEAFKVFKKEVTPFLERDGKNLSSFDRNNDGIIMYNEYVRICIFLRDSNENMTAPWVAPGQYYLAMRYLNRLVITPCVNTLDYLYDLRRNKCLTKEQQ